MTIKGKLKFGQFFKTRDGRKGVVCENNYGGRYSISAYVEEHGSNSYTEDGRFCTDLPNHPLDIVELINFTPDPEPREWDVVIVEMRDGNAIVSLNESEWKVPPCKILARGKLREGEGV